MYQSNKFRTKMHDKMKNRENGSDFACSKNE